MTETVVRRETSDPVWNDIVEQAEVTAREEPAIAGYLHAAVLNYDRLEEALSFHLAQKLGSTAMPSLAMQTLLRSAYEADPMIGEAARADLTAVLERDPACNSRLEPLLYFKGFHGLQSYRVAHWLWNQGRKSISFFVQNRISEAFGMDIHPAARIGQGIMIDHGTGVVIGETTVIEDDVSLLQNVTLGGTGKEGGDRHPKVRRGALVCAGAKVLGNIEIGECSKVGAASVVLHDVPARCTAVGVPARIVGDCCEEPARSMDQSLPDV